jgi:hypothetical protein
MIDGEPHTERVKTAGKLWHGALAAQRKFVRENIGIALTEHFDLHETKTKADKDIRAFPLTRLARYKFLLKQRLMPFGKYEKKKIAELPPIFRTWLRVWARRRYEDTNIYPAKSFYRALIDALKFYEEADGEKVEKEQAENLNRINDLEGLGKDSSFVGSVDEKFDSYVLTCIKKQIVHRRDVPVVLSVFGDRDRNIFVCFGVNPINKGETAILKFHVVKHTDYQDQKQTIIKKIQLVQLLED